MKIISKSPKTPSTPNRLRTNIVSLTAILVANIAIPLITLPYVTRTIGAGEFGKIAFAQAVMSFSMLFTDYAFSWSAVRDVASVQDCKTALSNVFSAIWTTQWLLTLISGIFLYMIGIFSGISESDNAIFVMAFIAIVLGNTAFPLWLFQGLEKMKYVAVIQILTRMLSIPLIFIFVKSAEDTLLVIGFQAATTLLAAILALFYIYKNELVNYKIPRGFVVFSVLKKGFPLFLSKFGINLYTTMTPLALGIVSGTTFVSYFSLADRIRSAGQNFLTPLSSALYPRLSNLFEKNRDEASKLVAKGLVSTVLIASVISTGLYFFATPAVILLGGEEFQPAIPLLELLSVLPVLVGLSNVFGVQIMLANGRTSPFNRIITCAAALGATAIWPLTYWLGAMGAAICVVGVEFFVTCAMAIYLSINVQLWKLK